MLSIAFLWPPIYKCGKERFAIFKSGAIADIILQKKRVANAETSLDKLRNPPEMMTLSPEIKVKTRKKSIFFRNSNTFGCPFSRRTKK